MSRLKMVGLDRQPRPGETEALDAAVERVRDDLGVDAVLVIAISRIPQGLSTCSAGAVAPDLTEHEHAAIDACMRAELAAVSKACDGD